MTTTPTPALPSNVEELRKKSQLQFYDEGWNARCVGNPYTTAASRDWKTGWKDADGVSSEERKPMP